MDQTLLPLPRWPAQLRRPDRPLRSDCPQGRRRQSAPCYRLSWPWAGDLGRRSWTWGDGGPYEDLWLSCCSAHRLCRELDAPPGPPSTHTSRRARARCGLPGVQPRVAMSLCAGSLTRGTSCTRGQQGAKGPASGGDLELRGDVGEGHTEALRVDGPPEGAGSRALPALLGTDGARPCVLDRHCPPWDRTRRLTAPSGLQGHLGQSGPT